MKQGIGTILGLGVAMLIAVFSAPATAQFPAVLSASQLDGHNGFTLFGQLFGEFGITVAGIGDVNGDGFDDVASGGPGPLETPHCGCTTTAGAAYVIFGRPAIGGTGTWNVQALDGSNGFRVPGIHPGDSVARVSAAGDFNHDGVDDFLLGAPSASPGGIVLAGEAYLIFGAPHLGDGGSFDVTTLNGLNGFTIHGRDALGGVGGHMAQVGDFNADGFSDIAVSSILADPKGLINAGQVSIIFGGQGSGSSGSIVVPDSLDAQSGLVINGVFDDGRLAGVAGAGDVNGDGASDLIISALGVQTQPLAEGQVYVIFGGGHLSETGVFDLAGLNGTNGFTINGPPSPGGTNPTTTGGRIAGVGDVNADGYDDIAVSVNVSTSVPGDWIGVVFGGPTLPSRSLLRLEDLDGTTGCRIVRAAGSVGTDVASVGDINHDGWADFLAGSVAVFGGPGFGSSGVVEIDDVQDEQHGFWFQASYLQDFAGARDVNHDGIDDILIGARYPAASQSVGKVYLIFGRRMGDADLDADVDFADFAGFQRCFVPNPAPDVPDACHPFDFDKDNDLDLLDLAAFLEVYGTPP